MIRSTGPCALDFFRVVFQEQHVRQYIVLGLIRPVGLAASPIIKAGSVIAGDSGHLTARVAATWKEREAFAPDPDKDGHWATTYNHILI
jgi:hypothetical protein